MAKKTAEDKPVKEKATVKKSTRKTEQSEPKEEKTVTKTAAKSEAADKKKPKAVKKAAAEKPAAKGKTRKADAAIQPEQLEEHIRVAAYYRWEERGQTHGAHEDDWLEAEKQIRK